MALYRLWDEISDEITVDRLLRRGFLEDLWVLFNIRAASKIFLMFKLVFLSV